MLRIAVPNKGSLSEPAVTLLAEAGYRTRRTGRELVLVDEAGGVELFFLRPRDIAVYVGQGTVHAGITGRDLLLDSGVDAVEHLALGFARSTFRFAAPKGTMSSLADVAGRRVVVLEDTSTTGGSPLEAVEALREAGADVRAVAVIVDRATGARERIEAAGLPYYAALGLADLGLE